MSLFIGLVISVAIAPLRLRPASEGDLLGWLVAGPYPNIGANEGKGTGFATDYLAGEASASPVEYGVNGSLAWHLAQATAQKGIDLKELFSTNDPGIAYCYTALDSPRRVHARLRFGSDDGAKVYLNGSLVFVRDIKRGVKRDEEDVPIELRPGMNRLLFKVEQYDGGWGLMARIVNIDGSRIQGLSQILEVDPGVDDALRLPRKLAGMPGSFDLQAYQGYLQCNRTASLFLERLRDSAADPVSLEQGLNALTMKVQSALSDADRASTVVEEGEARLREAYDAARLPLMRWAQNPGPCVDSNPEHEDFIHVMPGGRYFAHADNSPFIPIGCNHNPDWPELEESNPLGRNYDPKRTDRWFANLHEHGVNVVRLMVETPPSGNLEEKVGTFRPEHIIWLDHIFLAARRNRVKLWITPYDTFWMSLRKDASPYWHENGGPIVRPIDFLTKPEIIAAQEQRMKFLIDRYGNSGSVFAWEIMNEIDLWWDATPEQIGAWTDRMSRYVHDYERQRWRRNHMVTISFAEPEPKGLNAGTAFRRNDMDFATMHLYIGASRAPGPGDASRAGIDFASGVLYARAQVQDNRPVMDGESGPIDRWIADSALDDAVFHEMSWRHLMAGGAGPGTRWPYRNPHHISAGMLDTLHAMNLFCERVPWRTMTGKEVKVKLTGLAGSESAVFATEAGTIAWLRLPVRSSARDFSIHWDHRSHNILRLHAFDLEHRKWIDIPTKSEGDGFAITLPPYVSEIALFAGN